MKHEYIIQTKTTGGIVVTLFDDIRELIRCEDCQGRDGGRCLWWPDHPETPANGYCYQAERKEE